MGLYDEIKSPFNDETVIKLIDIYANGSSNGVKNGEDLYDEIVNYGSEHENNQAEYINEFNKYIKLPIMDRFYQKIKSMNIDCDIIESETEGRQDISVI